jgi:hypothetical protein
MGIAVAEAVHAAEGNTARCGIGEQRARAAGVEDQVTFARISWEPEKPCRMLRLVTGADACRGRTEGGVRCAMGWRIGA